MLTLGPGFGVAPFPLETEEVATGFVVVQVRTLLRQLLAPDAIVQVFVREVRVPVMAVEGAHFVPSQVVLIVQTGVTVAVARFCMLL